MSTEGSEGTYPFNKFQLNNCLSTTSVEDIVSCRYGENFRKGQPHSMFTVSTEERIRIKYSRWLFICVRLPYDGKLSWHDCTLVMHDICWT